MSLSIRNTVLSAILSGTFLAACNSGPPSRIAFDGKPNRGSSDGKGEVLGEGASTEGPTAGAPVEPPMIESKLALELFEADGHDALDYTYGIAQLQWSSALKDAAVSLKPGYLLKKGVSLTAEQKALATRLCKDLGLSERKDAYTAVTMDNGEDVFLVWRSHFGADIKIFLNDYLAKNGESLRCVGALALTQDGKRERAYIVFDALADQAGELVGSAKMEAALDEGLLLASRGVSEEFPDHQLEAISVDAKLVLNVPALNAKDVKVESAMMPGAEQCYLIALGGTSKAYNPQSLGGTRYKFAAKSEFAAGMPMAKVVDGRAIPECAEIKTEGKDGEIDFRLSCGAYFAIKDKGMEAGCAWDLPLVNKSDPENFLSVPLNLEKFSVKTRDGSRVSAQTSESIIPISGINDIRDGKVNLNALSKGQAQLLEDALDLWIAIDEDSYRGSFYNHIKTIGWDGACTYGAYAQYGSEMVTWCGGGALGERLTSRRFQDPNLLLYRAILAWHEVRHTQNFKHDFLDKSYKPCAGTAASARLAVAVVKTCDFDFCKQIRPTAASNYRSELNYDYSGDTTGRKSQGDCKLWSKELGVSGEGF